jgi:hypothetical protein
LAEPTIQQQGGSLASQTWLTILGGLISGLVGVGLFFLQRFKARRDEQQNLLFQIYEIIAVPRRPEYSGDRGAMETNEMLMFLNGQKEIHSLALLLKDKDFSRKIYRVDLFSKAEREALLKELEGRLNPKLRKLLDKEPAAITKNTRPQ